MQDRYKLKLELGVAVVVALTGAFFIYHASFIRPALNDPIGPKVLPMFLAISLVVGAALLALRALLGKAGIIRAGYGFQESNLGRIFAVIACGAIYVAAFWAFGYFAATFIAAVLIMLTFGNRSILTIAVVALLSAMVYQFVFMGMMGLFDPAGKVLDLRAYTNWISGAQ